MKTIGGICAGVIISTSLSVSAAVIWSEDFENASIGATSTINSDLAGTTVASKNSLTMEVALAPAGWTGHSGQVVKISSAGNGYESIVPASYPISFGAVPVNTPYTMSFDLYIPGNLTKVIGDFRADFSLDGGTAEKDTLTGEVKSSSGMYSITYQGIISDFTTGLTSVNEVLPFLGFDQGGVSVDGLAYVDNIKLEIQSDDLSPIDPAWFANLRANRVESNPLVQWQHFGPGMSGYIDMFWINNGDPNAMYDSLDMGNSQVTLNGGKFWKSMRDSDGCGYHPDYYTAMDFSFTDPDVGLAVRRNVKRNRGEIHRTTDRGASWEYLTDPIAGDNKKHNVIAVDPGNDDHWYMGAGGGAFIKDWHYTKSGIVGTSPWTTYTSAGFILYSKDQGANWTKVSAPFPSDSSFSALIVDPRDSSKVYASCQSGVYKSTNGGVSWAKVTGNGLPYNNPRYMTSFYDAAAHGGAGEFILYIVEITHYEISGSNIMTSGGVFRSADGGTNWENLTGDLAIDMTQMTNWSYREKFKRAVLWWQEMDLGMSQTDFWNTYNKPTSTFSQFHMIGVDPTNKDRVYLIHNPKHDYSFPPGNIWMTENGGINWYAAAREGTYWRDLASKSTDYNYWRNIRAVQPLGTNTKMAHVDREHRENLASNTGPRFLRVNQLGHVYTAFAQQIMRSTDHGVSWNQVDDDETVPDNGHWVGRGNSNLPGESFCLKTGTPGTYLWGSGEHGLWRNTHDGDLVYPGAIALEQLTGQSIDDSDPTSISTIAVDPSNTNRIFTLQFRQDHRGKLRGSTDGGATWNTIGTPLPTTMDIRQNSLLIDHTNADNMYFTVPLSKWTPYGGNGKFRPNNSSFSGHGIYKSIDGGQNWSMANTGIPSGASVLELFMDPYDSQRLYAASNQSHDDVDGGLYKTDNGGASWTAMTIPAGVTSVNDVMIHEASGDMYIACGNQEGDGSVGGAYVSRDDGSSWTLVFDMPYVRGIDPCAANDEVMAVIAGNDEEIGELNPGSYVTIDGAATWHKINLRHGQPEKVGVLKCDPYDDSVLWCCLSGTGFWKMDISALKTGVAKPFFWDWMDDQGITDRTGDTDGDGFDNQLEYIADTDPTDSNSYFVANISPDSSGSVTVGFQSAQARLYTIEKSEDLIGGKWNIFTNQVSGSGEVMKLMDSSGSSNGFYRIMAELE